MKLFNFSNIGNSLEDFLQIKLDVENKLLDNGSILEKMDLQTFITNTVANTIIYFSRNKTIPFQLLNGKNNEVYVIYTLQGKDDELIKELVNKLEVIHFDISNLTKMELKDTLGMNYEKETFFIKDGSYYK